MVDQWRGQMNRWGAPNSLWLAFSEFSVLQIRELLHVSWKFQVMDGYAGLGVQHSTELPEFQTLPGTLGGGANYPHRDRGTGSDDGPQRRLSFPLPHHTTYYR